MKKLITYCSIILLSLLISACGDSSPTELIFDDTSTSDDIDVRVLSPEPGVFVYGNGYDSTGVFEPVQRNLSVISISGIKNSYQSLTTRKVYYTALFFDKNDPIQHPGGGRRLGFRSKAMGRVLFNTDTARVVPHIIPIKAGQNVSEIKAGVKHELQRSNVFAQSPQDFPNSASIRFRLIQRGQDVIEFNIPTPEEITGEVLWNGSLNIRNLDMKLRWNNLDKNRKIEIVIGGIRKDKRDIFPLLSVTTRDDGDLKIPKSFIEPIPFSDFDRLVFTFVREIKTQDSSISRLNDPFVVAKSIHNIHVDIK